MNLKFYTTGFILLTAVLMMTLFSCNQESESVPFPSDKSEFTSPTTTPLEFSKPQKFEWQVNDSVTFERPVPIKVDLASVPSKPFYPDGFIPLDKPMMEIDIAMTQDTVINIAEVPSEPIKFETSILEPPIRVKARLPKLNKNASVGIFEFGEDQGLPGYLITALMEDSHGMIWIATDKGLCRFDGEYIETYDIIDERFTGAQTVVVSILEDDNGRIWVYTADMGFYVLDLHAGIVRNAFLVQDRMRFNVGNIMIRDSKGMLWFGTSRDGIFVVDPSNFSSKHLSRVRSDGNVRILAEDGFGKMWAGSDSGLSLLDMNSGVIQSIEDQPFFSFDFVSGLFCDSENNIWVGTDKGGITKIHSDREGGQVLGSAQGVQTPVHHFTEGNHGKIWMSSFGGGVYVFDPIGQSLKHLNEEKSLMNDQATTSLLDSRGQIWMATTKGLNLMDTEGLMPNFLTEEDGLSWPNIWSFMEDKKGDLWLGSWERMDIYDSENNTIKRVDLALQLEKNVSIPFEPKHMPSGNYLIKAPSLGFAVFNPERETITKVTPGNGLTNLYQSACFVDRSGKIWTGAFRNRGVEVFDPKTNTFKRLNTEEGMIGNIVWGIAEDALGQIWIGTDLGVNIINPKENTISYLMEGESITTRNFGAFLTDAQDRLWMGSRSGILIADQQNDLLTRISPENGLISEEVYTLYEHNGVMYAGTENGLSTFTPPPNFGSYEGVLEVKSFAKEQGLIFNNYNADAAIAYDDKLWLGIETEVLTVIDFPKKDTVQSTTYISGIAISDQTRNFYDYKLAHQSHTDLDTLYSAQKDTFYLAGQYPEETDWLAVNDIRWDGLEGIHNLPVNLEIPFEQNYVSFQFTGNQLTNRNKTRYSYYLNGIDKVWSDLSVEPYSKNYRNLPAGDYTFNVRSQSFDGIWTDPAELSFTILPHWANTWWAWIIYITMFTLVVGAIVQYRSRALKKENIVLEERVKHRTAQLTKSVDDLKSTQSQLVQSEKMASLGELTAGIAHEIQNPLNFVNNFSEVNTELIEEMKEELDKGNLEEVQELANDIIENEKKIMFHGKRADAIVKGMLQHSRTSNGKKEPTDINALSDEYLRLAYHGLRAKDKSFNATMVTDFDDSIGNVDIIPQDIGRVILNLITNAFYVVDEKKKSGLENYEPTVTVSTKKVGEKIEIQVMDNGNGIPDKILNKIFEPFFTTKPTGKGTGLGLSLSYDIVKAHGGELKVETEIDEGNPNQIGKGTTFTILLPTN